MSKPRLKKVSPGWWVATAADLNRLSLYIGKGATPKDAYKVLMEMPGYERFA